MTKREIFERLQSIRDYARVTDTWPHDNAEQQNLHLRNAVEAIAKDLGELLLDLAAPDDHIADAGKMVREEEKHPGVLAKPGKDGEIEFCWCQKCYAKADVVHDPFGDGEDWSYCKTCGVSFRLKHKRGEAVK